MFVKENDWTFVKAHFLLVSSDKSTKPTFTNFLCLLYTGKQAQPSIFDIFTHCYFK